MPLYFFAFWDTKRDTFFPWNPKHVLWRLSYAVPCSCSFLNKKGYELKSPFMSISLATKSSHKRRINTNLLLTQGEGRTGEYWPEVVAVRTEQSEVRTKTTEGQYSPVRLELARLVSSLLYGTDAGLFCVKTHFRSLEFKRLPPCIFDDASNSKRRSYHEFENKFNARKSCWI